MFRSLAAIALAFVVDAAVELQPDADWQKVVAERRKQHKPSPKQVAAKFHKAEVAQKKVKKEHQAYLKSPEHHAEMVHAGNKMAQKARHQITSQDDGLNEKHCGMNVPFSDAGYKNTETVRHIFHLTDSYATPKSFLQGSGGPSMAQPGAGHTQMLKDEGRGVEGTVRGVEKGKDIEPFYKVFKDGWSFTLCAKDDMYDFGDKYGNNKDQYKQKDLNVSIVHYSEIVLKENQKAMTPKICFEFCRTVPDMVYFGVRTGTDCYCMPFFTKAESGTESCDYPCPGDGTQMCGGKTKSQLFEMHMCADTAGDLLYSAVNAEQELVYMYDTVFMTDKIAKWLDGTGQQLQKVAGLGGDPGAADLGKLAIDESVSLLDDSTGWGVCKGQYVMLLEIYTEAEPLYDADFSYAKEIKVAEDSIMMMDNLKRKLHFCAKKSEGPIVDTYPFFFEFMAALDEDDFQKKLDKYADSLVMYYPALYSMNPMAPPEMSTCTGTPVGKPMSVPLAGCAEACNRMITPPYRCTAFQYFQIQDGDKQMPLCFLFREIDTIRSYRCDALPSLAQSNTSLRGKSVVTANQTTAKSFMSDAKSLISKEKTAKMDICEKVKHAKRFSGMSCEAMFGLRSEVIKSCPDECANNQGMKYTALCMTRLSSSAPMAKVKNVRKCFGQGNGPADQSNADFRLVEFGQDASGGAGPKIEGDLQMDGTVIKEPYGYVWTPGPAGAR